MATHNLLLLPGDGIGPEVMAQVKRVIDFFNKKGPDKFTDRGGAWSAAAATTPTGSPSPTRPWRRPRPPTR